MPFRKPQSISSKFLGRVNELQIFLHDIVEPEYPSFNIFSISGQGGVGKSTLITQFMENMRSSAYNEYCCAGFVDERDMSADRVMEKFAEQLHLEGDFKKALSQYKRIVNRLQSEREAMRDTLVDKAPALIGSAIEDVPLAGKLLKEGTELATGYLVSRYRTQQFLKDVEKHEDPMGDLTQAFVSELNRFADTSLTLQSSGTKHLRRVILFFDTFEQLAAEIAPWLLNHFLVAEISPCVVLVIAGRIGLELSTPDDPKRWLPYLDDNTIYALPLESFTEAETYAYLQVRGIQDTQQLERLWHLSRGLPLYLSMLTTNTQGQIDPTSSVVANFLRWIPEQEKVKRQLALDASLFSMPFNQDDLQAFSYTAEDQHALFTWLVEQPFVRQTQYGGRYMYHDLAQELFSRHLYQRSPIIFGTSCQALASYYQSCLDVMEQEVGPQQLHTSNRWQEYLFALAIQLFCLPRKISRVKAVECIFSVCEHSWPEVDSIRVLRQFAVTQANFEASKNTQLLVETLLQYIDASQVEETLATLNYLVEHVTTIAESSSRLLSYLYCTRARLYRNLDQLDLARADFDRAIAYDSLYQRAYAGRGETYRLQASYLGAIADFDQALLLDPKNIWCYLRRGLTYYQLDDYAKAIIDLKHVIELDPQEVVAYDFLGETYRVLCDQQQAIAVFDQALVLAPKRSDMYNSRGLTYLEANDYQQAIKDFTQAIELDPSFADAYANRARVFVAQLNYEEAIADYTHSIELDPILASTYDKRARIFSEQKDYVRAIADYTKTVELDPANAGAYNNRGLLFATQQKYEAATRDYTQALEIDATLAIIYDNRGIVFVKQQRYEEAIVDYSKAIELEPMHVNAYYNRGLALCGQQHYEEALVDYTTAIALGGNDVWSLIARSNAYFELKEYNHALADLDRVIVLEPENASCYLRRAYLYLRMGDLEHAHAQFVSCWTQFPTEIDSGWMAEFVSICLQRPSPEMADRLELIANVEPQSCDAYICRAVACWLREDMDAALKELELALLTGENMQDAYFWQGMLYALLGRDVEALDAIEEALKNDLPPVLLSSLRWLEQDAPQFYTQHIRPLFETYKINV